MCEHCTRREFLGTGVLSALAASASWSYTWASEATPVQRPEKVKIGVLWSGSPGPADRGWNTDPPHVEQMQTVLKEVEQKLGNVELVYGKSENAEQTKSFLAAIGEGTPILAINLSCFALTRLVGPILEARHPMIVFSLPASGHDWMYPHRWQRGGHRVTLFATSDLAELEHAVRLLRVIPLLKQTRILLFPPARGTAPACSPELIKERLGAEVLAVEQSAFDEMMAAVEEDAVREEAQKWIKGAKQIIEPTEEDIAKAARVSVALNRLMDKYQAQGLAVGTCMGWLPRGFPCLGFARLRDRGLPAACEGDMDSLLTMLIFRYAFDKPGFQGNATFDTSRNVLWTAHCTGPLKLDSIDGPEHPYLLRGHSEVGGSGCVPEVQYRVGEVITRTKFVNLDTLLISTAKIVEVPEKSVHGCRTQLVSEVRDAAKMVANWSSALQTEDAMTLLHRVVFYGDHLQSAYHLARLMGWNVIEEG
ncbi:hypothetical protein [Thermogutta sp.]|uniref:hypothetical protein n=1 Tax=Thermogutta sp. TaxID=1962930 RepID=UPI00321F6E32